MRVSHQGPWRGQFQQSGGARAPWKWASERMGEELEMPSIDTSSGSFACKKNKNIAVGEKLKCFLNMREVTARFLLLVSMIQ